MIAATRAAADSAQAELDRLRDAERKASERLAQLEALEEEAQNAQNDRAIVEALGERPTTPDRTRELVPRHRGMDRLRQEPRNFVVGYAQLDASRLAWSATNQPELLKFHDHPMDGRRCDSEEGLHVGLGWRSPVEQSVGVDEGEVLPLLLREPRLGLEDRQEDVPMIDGSEGSHHEHTVPHHADVRGA
jgi:hypothetical protein